MEEEEQDFLEEHGMLINIEVTSTNLSGGSSN